MSCSNLCIKFPADMACGYRGNFKGLQAEDAETPTTHVVYHLVTKLGRLRALHLRKVQPHSDSSRQFMMARSFLHAARIGFRSCIGHWISNTSSDSSRFVSSLSDYAVRTCKDIIQECTTHQCPPQLSHPFYWTNGNILEVPVHDPHNAKSTLLSQMNSHSFLFSF